MPLMLFDLYRITVFVFLPTGVTVLLSLAGTVEQEIGVIGSSIWFDPSL